tara:strand:- start:195 stop:374 length:180 start_codon:yes stop_codon:yes gene_type:complete
MFEHPFQCPYCWGDVSMLLDPSLDNTEYIEDCEICCNPINLTYGFKDQNLIHFQAQKNE